MFYNMFIYYCTMLVKGIVEDNKKNFNISGNINITKNEHNFQFFRYKTIRYS